MSGPRRRTVVLSGLAGLVVAGVPTGLYLSRSTGSGPGLLATVGTPVPFHSTDSGSLNVRAVAFHPSGRLLAAFHDGAACTLWDIGDPSNPTQVATGGATLSGVTGVFTPDGRTLIGSGTGANGAVTLWDVTDPAHPAAPATLSAPAVSVDCVALHPGGRLLAVASSDAAGETATLSMWDLTTPAAPARLSTIEPDGYGRIDGMAFSSDGRTLVAGDDDASADASGLWDVTDPRRVRPLGAFTGDSENGAGSGVFSPDGRVVFTTGGQSGTVRVWNVADPAKPALLDAFTEHTAQSSLYVEVNGLAVSPSGRTLAVADPDSTARLWNITDPAHPVLKATLTGHVAAVTSVGFSRDGRLLATTSIDHTFRLWTAAGR